MADVLITVKLQSIGTDSWIKQNIVADWVSMRPILDLFQRSEDPKVGGGQDRNGGYQVVPLDQDNNKNQDGRTKREEE